MAPKKPEPTRTGPAAPRPKAETRPPERAGAELREPTPRRAGRIALVGQPNVGKSTLLNRLIGEPIAITSKHPQTTRDQILGILTTPEAQFVFVDTPGVHAPKSKLGVLMNERASEAARGADIVFFVVDATRLHRGLGDEDRRALAAVPDECRVVLVLNKIDKIKEKAKLLPLLEALSKEGRFAAYVPISAQTGNGCEGLLKGAQELLPEGDLLFPEDELSDRPVRFFVAEFVREQILRYTRQEVPHGVAVVVEHFDESLPVPRIDVLIHVDRESHKPIVIGAGGQLLKAVGTDARAKVEELLGRHVNLQLRVRVTPRWYESDAQLRDLGYVPTEKLSSSS